MFEKRLLYEWQILTPRYHRPRNQIEAENYICRYIPDELLVKSFKRQCYHMVTILMSKGGGS